MKDKLRNFLSNQNNVIVAKNAFFAFLIKGGGLAISLLSTPAFIKYFNNEAVLGVWYTLLSILIWFLNFDLGIGNGVRNNLVKAFTKKDYVTAKKIISSGVFSTGIVTVCLMIIGFIILSLLDLHWLFNVSEHIISERVLYLSVIFVFIAIMLRFLLTTVTSVFYAMQKSAVNNFLTLCVSLLQLFFVLLVRFDDPEKGILVLSISYIFTSNLPVILAGVVVFSTKLKECRPNIRFVEKESIRKVMGIGSVFFICQILYMIIMNTNEFLITNIFGPEYTTQYTFYHKISSLLGMVVSLAMTPIWSVVTKSIEEGNFQWLSKLYKTIKLVGILMIIIQFAIVPFFQIIMNIWLGKGVIEVEIYTVIAFACFGSVHIYSSMLSTIVCGMARMKLQTVFYLIGVVLKVLIVVLSSKIFDNWSIVVWSNFIILLPYCIAQQIDLNYYIKNKMEDKL